VRHDELELPLGGRAFEALVHGTGIRLVDMPRGYERLLRDYIIDRKRKRLQEILELIRRNRYH
jgi:hypothetical protein